MSTPKALSANRTYREFLFDADSGSIGQYRAAIKAALDDEGLALLPVQGSKITATRRDGFDRICVNARLIGPKL